MANRPTVLISSFAWKGTLTPVEANGIIVSVLEAAWGHAWTGMTLPLSDGGDGWLETLKVTKAMGCAQTYSLTVMGPVPQAQVEAHYLWYPQHRRACVEAADIHGMRRLGHGEPAPLTATTYGVGEAFVKILSRHPDIREIILSVGGSASTDGGLGFLQAMGWQFHDATGERLPPGIGGGMLSRVHGATPPEATLFCPTVTVILDVEIVYADAPRCFGPQKGVNPQMVKPLTEAFNRIARMLDPGFSYAHLSGTGAAGGLPFGVLVGCPGATLQPGMAWLAKAVNLDSLVSQADLVITGEGCFDETSLLGKGTGDLIERTQAQGKPLLILCGKNTYTGPLPSHVNIMGLYAPDEPIGPDRLEATSLRLGQVLQAGISTIAQMLA